MRHLMLPVVLLVLTHVSAAVVHAQRFLCLEPGEPRPADATCVLRLPPGEARLGTLRLRLLDSDGQVVPSKAVTVEHSSGTMSTSLITDSYGEVRASWQGTVGSTDVILTFRADLPAGGSIAQRVVVRAGAPATGYGITRMKGDEQWWFQERQLPKPVVVRITGVPAETDCGRALVLFSPKAAGGVSPDSVYGKWTSDSTCTASTRWRLGKEVGRQHLRAALANEPVKQQLLWAGSRAVPRLVGGIVLAYTQRMDTLIRKDPSVRVQRPGAGGTVTFDSVPDSFGRGRVPSRGTFSPMIAIDHPLWPSLEHVRLMTGVSVNRPREDFFFGASILQSIFGVSQEGIGIDLQVVMQVSNRRVLKDASLCASSGICETIVRTRPVGAGLALTLDTGGLLTNLLGAFK